MITYPTTQDETDTGGDGYFFHIQAEWEGTTGIPCLPLRAYSNYDTYVSSYMWAPVSFWVLRPCLLSGLKLPILLSLFPKCWYYRRVPDCITNLIL